MLSTGEWRVKKNLVAQQETPKKISTCPNILNMQIFQSVAAHPPLSLFISLSLSLCPFLSYFLYFCFVAVALYFHLPFFCELEPKLSRNAYGKREREGELTGKNSKPGSRKNGSNVRACVTQLKRLTQPILGAGRAVAGYG